MLPEDRVLVGVINRLRDLKYARDAHWYRIPQARMPRGVHADYLAFFLSGKVFKELTGGIHYYASYQGVELRYRHDLLPEEAQHKRANEIYYRIALSDWREKTTPILNPTQRPISFIYTTWDRFAGAQVIADLYSQDDYFVDRIYHVLRDRHPAYPIDQYWSTERRETQRPAGLRVLCERGPVDAWTEPGGDVYLDPQQPDDDILRQILDAMARRGGPSMLSLSHPE
jgi:hypothetical protein